MEDRAKAQSLEEELGSPRAMADASSRSADDTEEQTHLCPQPGLSTARTPGSLITAQGGPDCWMRTSHLDGVVPREVDGR